MSTVTPLYQRLREKREKAGITRQALAARLGAAYTTVWRWENGDVVPAPAALAGWKAVLELLVREKGKVRA